MDEKQIKKGIRARALGFCARAASHMFWNKYKPIIEEMRVLMDTPDMYSGIEALAYETDKYRASKGLRSKLSSTMTY